MSTREIEIQKCDISDLNDVMYKDGVLQVRPYKFIIDYIRNRNELLYFMHVNGIYVLPTTELIDFLRGNIVGTAIEIGAGHGAIGRALGIPITDSYMQKRPEIQFLYFLQGQPPIEYPVDVEKLAALEAVEKYKPQTVIGAFITHLWKEGMDEGNTYGVDEELILSKVEWYINIGNLVTHGKKPLLSRPHSALWFPWLVTRSIDQSMNRIFVFRNNDYGKNK